MTFSPVAVIPVYNHPERLADVVAALRALDLAVILVDDGSDTPTAEAVDKLAHQPHVQCVRLARNQGKGGAVVAGLEAAESLGYTHAVQIDADGQHDAGAVPRLLREAEQQPDALVSGRPVYDASVPRGRLYGRYVTHAWVWIETLSFRIPDSMCGFRVYPVAATLGVVREERVGKRMDFDTEILVRLYWRNVPLRFIPVQVSYPEGGVSHFDVWRDNLLISRMHARLFFGMLWRLPKLLARKLSRTPRHRSGAWARIGERGSLTGMRLLAGLTRVLGHRAARVVLHPLVLYFMIVNGDARRASISYLSRMHAQVKPELQAATRPSLLNVYRHFHAFAQSVFEKFAVWHALDQLPPLRASGREIMYENTRNGRGMLLLSAHLGNLEMCRALSRQNPNVRVNALVHTRNARKFSQFMREVNPDFHERLILVEHIGPDTAVQIRTLLDRGEIVVMVADRTPVAENGRIVHTHFLGERAPFAAGPYILAHLLECPVGLVFCLRGDDGAYDVFMEPFADRIRLPRKQRDEALAEHATRFAQRLEYHALQRPLQWFNFYNFWAEDGGAQQQRHARAVEMKANG